MLLNQAATALPEDGSSLRSDVCISRLTATAYVIPTDRPESDGTLEWDRTTLVVVELEAGGERGLGYSYASAAAAKLIVDELAPALADRSALDIPAHALELSRTLRNVGRPGIGATAISAVDNALWDLKGRLLGMSLLDLLGAARGAIPAYGSGGFTSYSDAELGEQLGSWAGEGFGMVKMKIGREPERDPHRLEVARSAIGTEVELFVDANGAFTPRQAIAVARWLADYQVSWFEEPVSSDDLVGLNRVRRRVPAGMEVSAGEYAWTPTDFVRLIDSGAVDVLQVDATRCLGISGFLAAAEMCRARNIPLSTHCAPSLHAQLACAAPAARHIEWFHDHVRIEQLLFDGAAQADVGRVRPDRSRPGLGLELRRPDAEQYLSWKGEWRA